MSNRESSLACYDFAIAYIWDSYIPSSKRDLRHTASAGRENIESIEVSNSNRLAMLRQNPVALWAYIGVALKTLAKHQLAYPKIGSALSSEVAGGILSIRNLSNFGIWSAN